MLWLLCFGIHCFSQVNLSQSNGILNSKKKKQIMQILFSFNNWIKENMCWMLLWFYSWIQHFICNFFNFHTMKIMINFLICKYVRCNDANLYCRTEGNIFTRRYKMPKEPNYRQIEKKILDDVLKPDKYDPRIRPAGLNTTGNVLLFLKLPNVFIIDETKYFFRWSISCLCKCFCKKLLQYWWCKNGKIQFSFIWRWSKFQLTKYSIQLIASSSSNGKYIMIWIISWS